MALQYLCNLHPSQTVLFQVTVRARYLHQSIWYEEK